MNKTKKETINNIFIILAFTFNITIFAPLEIFYTNKSEFWFEVYDIMPIIILTSIIIFMILSLITFKLREKKRDNFIKIIFVLALGLYIQGNFLNFGYSVLDGSQIQWSTMIKKGVINTAIWILIIMLPYIFAILKKEKQVKIFSKVCSVVIILIEAITLLVLVINLKENREDNIKLTNKEIFKLSENQNIVVFMSDTFEATYMNQILEEYPEYKEKLKNFTYFDNCTGVSFYTYSSMPILLTGVECKVGNTLEENVKYCFDNSILYKELAANNYNINIYTEEAIKNDNGYISNFVKKEYRLSANTKIKLANKMYKYTLYRYLPHFLKSSFVVNSDEFYAIKREEKELKYKEKSYFLDDVAFNQELVENGITTDNKQNVFKFYQTNGLHMPYNTTADLEYDYSDEYNLKPEEEKRYIEGIASINLLCNYIEELKKKNIYENTTIIFLADHGYENRFYTTLLVKKANDSHDFKISSAPVSLTEDLVPTILNIATSSKNYGKDFFDYDETEIRTRQVYDYTYKLNFFAGNTYKVVSKIVFQTEELAKSKEAFYMVDEEYENDDKELTEKYKFGETIKANKIIDSKSVNLRGFALETIDIMNKAGCNISKNAYLIVNSLKTENDVTAEFVISRVYDEEQTIIFKIADETIYTCKINNNETENKISFKIPKDIWNEKEEITIKMEFPDADFAAYNNTMMTAIILDEVSFNNK